MKREELELSRHGATPAQFLAYVRAMIRKHGLTAIDPADIQLGTFAKGGEIEFDYHDDPAKPCASERSISKPYEMQTYVRNWDGTVYNLILEFDFWDEKTGFGYFYFLNTWEDTETTAEPATETETTETTESETAKNEKEEETMFPNLTKAINTHYDTAAEKFTADLLTVTAGYALDHAYYRDLMTPKAFDECKALDPADLLPETIRAKMTARFTRKNERDRADRLAKLTRAENAEPLENASIAVEWKRSTMWGSNPTATVIANYDANHATEGRASGCGYDKESAAIATAINASPSIMRVLYEHAENGGNFPYSVYTYAGLPYFDGGCGVSCFRNVFGACGYRWEDGAHRKTFDVYTLTRA